MKNKIAFWTLILSRLVFELQDFDLKAKYLFFKTQLTH